MGYPRQSATRSTGFASAWVFCLLALPAAGAAAIAGCDLLSVFAGGVGLECESDRSCAPGLVCANRRCSECSAQIACQPGLVCGIDDRRCHPVAGSDAGPRDAAADIGSASDAVAAADRAPADRPGIPDAIVDLGAADAAGIDAAAADRQATELRGPDRQATDSAVPDAVMPDVAVVDAAMPDVAVVDATSADSGSAWWNSSWTRRRRIVFDNRAGAEALVEFPVLIALDTGRIDYLATQDQGQDLRFVDDDGATALPYEIERWDESGASFVWVAVRRIEPGSDRDFIWMYYGNAAVAAGQNRAAVWNSGFRAVWHLQQSPAGGIGAIADSTASGKHGSALNLGDGNSVVGQIDRALDFNRNNEVVRIDSSASAGDPLDVVGGPLTLEAWVYFQHVNGTIVAKRNLNRAQWQLQSESMGGPGGNPSLIWSDAGEGLHIWYSAQTVTLGRWQHVAVTVDSNGVPTRFYLDGQPSAPIQQAHDADPPVHWDVDVSIGARWDGPPNVSFALDSIIDEVRISAVARSDGWMAASYASMARTFAAIDGEERH